MPYQAPLGNAIVGRFGSAGYVAPAPKAIRAIFAPGGSTPPARITLGVSVRGAWRAGANVEKRLSSQFPGAEVLVRDVAARSGAAVHVHSQSFFRWPGARELARTRLLKWLPPADTVRVSAASMWPAADDMQASVIGAWIAGREVRNDRVVLWPGAADRQRAISAAWRGGLMAVIVPVGWSYPNESIVVDVIGGGIKGVFGGPGYSAPAGNAIVGRFGAAGYIAPQPRFADTSDIKVPLRSASFVVGAATKPLLDGAGNPVMDRAIAESSHRVAWGTAARCSVDRVIVWSRYSRSLSPDWGIVIPPGPTPPPEGEQIVVPFRRAYIVVNEALLVRADAAAVINAAWLRINIDADSWLLSWSAEIPWNQLDAVMPSPDPVELIAYVNGYEFRLLVRGRPGESRQFGQRAVQVEGDGVAAVIASPLADQAQHTNSTVATAQQLIIGALEYTGFTVTWEVPDWTVPAGALSVFGAPIDVALHVAGAIGAVLQANAASDSIRVSPRYPVLPWAWAAAEPDVVLPAGVVEHAGVECIDSQFYNAVFVSGVASGISANVKRAGQAADKPAPQPVTHPLITHVDAARQRGDAVLGGAGRKIMRRLRLPVLPETGVIQLGRLVQFTDGGTSYRGIVRANAISVEFPVIRQTITIEATA